MTKSLSPSLLYRVKTYIYTTLLIDTQFPPTYTILHIYIYILEEELNQTRSRPPLTT